ncbi:MAG: amidase family protein, partial [Thermoleophilia bacterium]|nr:amidase family protein [Thermoleophilia bacterium]
MEELTRLGAEELLDAYRSREASPVDVVGALAARIEAVDEQVGAFTTLCLDRALVEARAAEAAWAQGEPRPLEGVP